MYIHQSLALSRSPISMAAACTFHWPPQNNKFLVWAPHASSVLGLYQLQCRTLISPNQVACLYGMQRLVVTMEQIQQEVCDT